MSLLYFQHFQLGRFLSKRTGLLLSLFLITIATSYLSIYIPHLSITLTLESLPLLLTGYLFGPVVGAINGAITDLITFPWGNGYPFSWLFFLQPITIGFFGGINWFLKRFDRETCLKLLVGLVISFTLLYCSLFPSETPLLIFYSFIFLSLAHWAEKKDKRLVINLLIIFALLLYISSFGIGVLGSMLLNKLGSPLTFFKVRTIKELVKITIFFPFCLQLLKKKYESVK